MSVIVVITVCYVLRPGDAVMGLCDRLEPGRVCRAFTDPDVFTDTYLYALVRERT